MLYRQPSSGKRPHHVTRRVLQPVGLTSFRASARFVGLDSDDYKAFRAGNRSPSSATFSVSSSAAATYDLCSSPGSLYSEDFQRSSESSSPFASPASTVDSLVAMHSTPAPFYHAHRPPNRPLSSFSQRTHSQAWHEESLNRMLPPGFQVQQVEFYERDHPNLTAPNGQSVSEASAYEVQRNFPSRDTHRQPMYEEFPILDRPRRTSQTSHEEISQRDLPLPSRSSTPYPGQTLSHLRDPVGRDLQDSRPAGANVFTRVDQVGNHLDMQAGGVPHVLHEPRGSAIEGSIESHQGAGASSDWLNFPSMAQPRRERPLSVASSSTLPSANTRSVRRLVDETLGDELEQHRARTPLSLDAGHPGTRRRHSEGDPNDPYQFAIHATRTQAPSLLARSNLVLDLRRRNSDADRVAPIRTRQRSVHFNDNPICPSPILPSRRRLGWFNRRGDQLWTNGGLYKPAEPGADYPFDLVDYPDPGDGWMNEHGTKIDMKHRMMPSRPLKSVLKRRE